MYLSRRSTLHLALATTVGLFSSSLSRGAAALERESSGYYLTGNAVRQKKLGPFRVDVYAISHFMRDLPPVKSKQAVIAMDTDKAFTWRLLRSLEAKQIRDALSDAYAMNGYTDAAKIALFLNAFTAPLPEGTTVQIRYATATKATTLSVGGGSTATVPGLDFMEGTWRIWFGKIDQSDLGDALIRRIPSALPPNG
jgi:hypothetical protein